MRNDTYLYTSGLDSARRSNQVALWRASHQANIACKKEIEERIRQGFDGMHLNSDCVKEVLEEFLPEWAKEKLEQLTAQMQQKTPGMGDMSL